MIWDKRQIRSAVFGLTAACFAVLAPKVLANDMTQFSDAVQGIQSKNDIVAIGAIALKDGKVLEEVYLGEKQIGTGLVISPEDRWHIGSITKSITATMIARLVERDIIEWNETIESILGTDKIHKQWRSVTVRQLLNHTSGAKPNLSLFTQFNRPSEEKNLMAERAKTVRKILRRKPKHKPGTIFQYSNTGYTIAGYLAEVKMGRSWESLVQEEVFNPLKLNSAGFGAPKSLDGNPVAWGHRGKKSIDPTEFSDNTPIMGPAGTAHMSLRDLAQFGHIHLKGLRGELKDYLSQETFQTLHRAVLDDYAMGWIEQKESKIFGQSIFWHNGSNTMWFAVLVAVPDENMVYAFATNSSNYDEAQNAFFGIMKKHFESSKETED